MTMTLIETIEVGAGGAASIEFTSIPDDGTDLFINLSLRSDRASSTDTLLLGFNSSSTNFTVRRLQGTGSAVSSQSFTVNRAGLTPTVESTSNTFGNAGIYISNYASSSNKSFSVDVVTENNSTSAYQEMYAGQWANTSAITSISLSPEYGTEWLQYSTASLYKIS